MASDPSEVRHAALWLVGPDMPGLLNLGASFVAERGGNIDKDIADKFGEKAVVFMSITATPENIQRMDREKDQLKAKSGCGIVFQPMKEPTIPDGYQPDLYGFDIVTDDAPGLVAELTSLISRFGMLTIGHTGERRVAPGPRPQVQAGQKYVVLIPPVFDHAGFNRELTAVVKKHNGRLIAPLQHVPGLLWWW
jgi:glycine cleavage system regulatory protein